jgi:hypothetical protein
MASKILGQNQGQNLTNALSEKILDFFLKSKTARLFSIF